MKSPFFAGIDLGSSSIKVVIIDSNQSVIKYFIQKTSLQLEKDMEVVQEQLRDFNQSTGPIQSMVATGYGRKRFSAATITKPEILCHARGCFQEFPQACLLIDIGGQDNKIIDVNEKGNVALFKMNTKCAAGTGAFLEEIAIKANLTLDQLHALACQSTIEQPINSYCTVFAMTEVLKKIIEGQKLEDIARGVYLSIAERIREIYRAKDAPVILSGGVIHHNPLLVDLIRDQLKVDISLPESPQFTGALGAACFAHSTQKSEQ